MASELQIKTKLTIESRFDKNKIDGLPRIGQYAVEKIREQIIAKKITATGRTQKSLRYSVDGEKALRIIADSGDRAPISTLQYGREPGKMPPVSSIKEWIEAKRITYKSIAYKRQPSINWKPKYTPQERGLNSLAWAIASKIKKVGTERHKNPDPAVYSPVLKEVIELFTTFIAKKTEQSIVTQLMK
jgi:hypothetical protein